MMTAGTWTRPPQRGAQTSKAGAPDAESTPRQNGRLQGNSCPPPHTAHRPSHPPGGESSGGNHRKPLRRKGTRLGRDGRNGVGMAGCQRSVERRWRGLTKSPHAPRRATLSLYPATTRAVAADERTVHPRPTPTHTAPSPAHPLTPPPAREHHRQTAASTREGLPAGKLPQRARDGRRAGPGGGGGRPTHPVPPVNPPPSRAEHKRK